MRMALLNVEIPESIIIALNESENELMQKMKLFTAMEYYRENK